VKNTSPLPQGLPDEAWQALPGDSGQAQSQGEGGFKYYVFGKTVKDKGPKIKEKTNSRLPPSSRRRPGSILNRKLDSGSPLHCVRNDVYIFSP
jgi:hypothetical protein